MTKPSLKTIMPVIITALLFGCQNQSRDLKQMHEFGNNYTAAWNSGNPDNVASFYAEDGSLTINNGTPSEGRTALAATANSFMEAFPDMVLVMDSLVADGNTYRYHWTFTGTNTGPGGTGNKVIFSGFERWTINTYGLVQESVGTYDAEDYNQQVKGD